MEVRNNGILDECLVGSPHRLLAGQSLSAGRDNWMEEINLGFEMVHLSVIPPWIGGIQSPGMDKKLDGCME